MGDLIVNLFLLTNPLFRYIYKEMENLARTYLSEEEYIEQERKAPFKSERMYY
jgi:hypothetical protein